jgi:hypothetical protein
MNWESFMSNLTTGQMVPVVGNDLILVKDEDDTLITLNSYIARQLTRKFKIKCTGQEGIGDLVSDYPDANIISAALNIFNNVEEKRVNFDPLRKLAAITDFKFFVSTTLDDLLVKALYRTRNIEKNQVKVVNYSLQSRSVSPLKKEEEPRVTVFNLFGSFEDVSESALDDEGMLEHFFSLSNKFFTHPLADYFMEQVRNKILLFIGCDFPDWFMRFIIRIVSNQRYRIRVFSDYIVWDEIPKGQKFYRFFKQFNKNIYEPNKTAKGNVRVFIDELYEQWTKTRKYQPILYKETVFLSYNKQDQETADRLKRLLQGRGIRIVKFYKNDMESNECKDLIEIDIKKCKVFVPLISNNSLSNTQGFAYRVEWKKIEKRLEADKYYGESSFRLIPIIIDDTDLGDERIPGFMREFTMYNLNQDQDRIIEIIIDELTPIKFND